MASSLVDLVKITSNSTGTGAITLGAPVAGYRGVEALTNGSVYSYSIQDGSAWEYGRCTYLSASNQLIRTPIDSSDGGTSINIKANAQVAFTALAEDLNAVQLTSDVVAAAEAALAAAEQTAEDRAVVEAGMSAVVNGEAVYPNEYATALPQGVTNLSNDGIDTGSGGAQGTYAGGVTGGPTGFSWQYIIGVDGKIASYSILNQGLSSSNTAPTLSYPSGSVTGATVPVATVGSRVDQESSYWAISDDSLALGLWSNDGTATPAAVLDPDGNQIKVLVATGIAGTVQPYVNDAQAAASAAASAAANIGLSTQTTIDIIDTDQDADGRWWVQRWVDGVTRIQKPADGQGRRLDTLIDGNTSRIATLEAANLMQPPIQRLRLKKALYYSSLQTRQVSASDPITVGTTLTGTPSAPGTSLSSPVRIAKDDVRVKLLGGRYAAGTAFPATFFMYGQANTNGDTTTLTGNGLPASRSSNDTDIEFVLPAGQTVVEWIVIGQGSTGNFFVDIDGVGTNSTGYAAPSNSSGTTYTIPITFPASTTARTIRIISPWRPHGGFWVETGGTIASSTPLVSSSIAWMGNSITQGAVATVVPARYQRIASRMLGIHNAVNLGVGGSGWLQDYPSPSGYNFLERMIDIYEAVNGGPPDAVVWSGGINDVGVIGTGAYTPAQVGAQALTVLQTFRGLYPDIPQFVVGPFTDWNNPSYSTALYNTRDALFNAAAQVARVDTIDVSTLVTPANRDTIFNGTVNGPHPVDAGHAIYGDFIARAMAAYIERY